MKKNLKEITRINSCTLNTHLIIIVFFLIVLIDAGMRNKEWPGSLFPIPVYVLAKASSQASSLDATSLSYTIESKKL